MEPEIYEETTHKDTFGYDEERPKMYQGKNTLDCEQSESARKLKTEQPNKSGVIIEDENPILRVTFDSNTLKIMAKQIECKKMVLGRIKWLKTPSFN